MSLLKTHMLFHLADLAALHELRKNPQHHAATGPKAGVQRKVRPHPSQEMLQKRFEYRCGALFWKPQKIEGSMKHQKLKSWNERFAGKQASHVERQKGRLPRNAVHTRFNGKSVRYPAARLIWIWHNGAIPDNKNVDHKNRISTDDRIENLRLADFAQSVWNSGMKRNRKRDLPVGIYRYRNGLFFVELVIRGKRFFWRGFKTPEEASAVRQHWASVLQGTFYPGENPVPKPLS